MENKLDKYEMVFADKLRVGDVVLLDGREHECIKVGLPFTGMGHLVYGYSIYIMTLPHPLDYRKDTLVQRFMNWINRDGGLRRHYFFERQPVIRIKNDH